MSDTALIEALNLIVSENYIGMERFIGKHGQVQSRGLPRDDKGRLDEGGDPVKVLRQKVNTMIATAQTAIKVAGV